MKRIEFSDEELRFIIEQYTSHKMSTKELGEYFNCSKDTISRRLKEQNIELKPFFRYEDLTNQKFGHLTVVKVNQKRYDRDVQITSKPHRYWFCQCDCGNPNLVEVESSHLKNGHTTSCGCIKSLAEDKIASILNENHIPFKKEYIFSDLKGINNGILRYDFAILNDNDELQYLIEYNGKQHYILNGGWNTKEEFQDRQDNDLIKEDYAKKHNIPLIIIPYTVKPNNITLKHLLLKENINEVMA